MEAIEKTLKTSLAKEKIKILATADIIAIFLKVEDILFRLFANVVIKLKKQNYLLNK